MVILDPIILHVPPMSRVMKSVGDATSLAVIAASFLEYLPHLAAVLAIIWWLLRIYQTKLEIKKLKEKSDV